ncbi:MAG: hypothetical protein ABL898_11860, partial [Hyphomicrobiaceae bacterium]
SPLCTLYVRPSKSGIVLLEATFNKSLSGLWRVQLRRKGKYASKSFRLKADAARGANGLDDRAFRGPQLNADRSSNTQTVGNLIQLHFSDLREAGKMVGLSKQDSLEKMQREIGLVRMAHLDKQ